MQDFARVLRQALRHRRLLVGAILCSILTGALWGANIGIVYPFIEVVFYGESPGAYVDDRIAQGEGNVARLEAELAALGDTTASATVARDGLAARLEAERKQVARWVEWRPFAEAYLPDDPMSTVLWIVALLFSATLLKGLFTAVGDVLVSRVAQRTLYDLRAQLYRHVLAMDLAAFDQDRSSRLVARITHDVNIVGNGIRAAFGSAIREPLKLLACLGGAAFVSWRLLLLVLVITPPAAWVWRRMYRMMSRNSHENMAAMADVYAHLVESLAGIRVVKAFTMEAGERRRFHRVSSTLFRRLLRLSVVRAFIKPFAETVAVGVVCLALLAGAYLVVHQETALLGIPISAEPLGPSAMLLFCAFLVGTSDPARKMSGLSVTLQHSAAAALRVYRILSREPKLADPEHPRVPPRGASGIRLEGVKFRYSREAKALRGVDLDIAPGECVALVGPNGCGKSTLVDLVLRFYDPNVGSVQLGGIDLREMRVRDLRNRIGLVTQTTRLFDASVRENIRRARPSATDAEVEVAARQAGAHGFIQGKLAEGYDTIVGEGGSALSGGQAQRIAVARAFLRDPEILILDEATSHLDGAAEEDLVERLARFIPKRTTLLVTHRPALLRLAERIVVMDHGKIVDVGSHEELVGRCELYRYLGEGWRRLKLAV